MFAKGGAEAVREQKVPEDDEREQGGMSSIVSSSEGVPGGSCSALWESLGGHPTIHSKTL